MNDDNESMNSMDSGRILTLLVLGGRSISHRLIHQTSFLHSRNSHLIHQKIVAATLLKSLNHLPALQFDTLHFYSVISFSSIFILR
jgi:hypothetical protein